MMQFGGYSVDDIGSFRQHFSIRELLDAIRIRIVFADWLRTILKSGSLERDDEERVGQIRERFEELHTASDEGASDGAFDGGRAPGGAVGGDTELRRCLSEWSKSVRRERGASYRVFCEMLLLVLDLGEYTPFAQDMEIVYRFLTEEGYFKPRKLRLVCEGARCGLYCGERFVTTLAAADAAYCGRGIVHMARHPDTGYIGIDADGRVWNGSAFSVPEVGGRAVKVCMNQGAYALLLEDGSIVTNLRYSIKPEAPVMDIELNGEQLIWSLLG